MKSDSFSVLEVAGLPLEWWFEIDAACDQWLKRHKAKPLLSIRQQITRERRLREHEKRARKRYESTSS